MYLQIKLEKNQTMNEHIPKNLLESLEKACKKHKVSSTIVNKYKALIMSRRNY